MKSTDWKPLTEPPTHKQEILLMSKTGYVVHTHWHADVKPNAEWIAWQPWADPPKLLPPFQQWFMNRYGRPWCESDEANYRDLKACWDAATVSPRYEGFQEWWEANREDLHAHESIKGFAQIAWGAGAVASANSR